MGRKVSLHELSQHARGDDIWIVVNGRVYDVTKFAPEHPGGSDGMTIQSSMRLIYILPVLTREKVIYQFAGRDASTEYNRVHSASLIHELDDHFIGDLDSITPAQSGQSNPAVQLITPRTPNTPKPPLEEIINLDDFEKAAQQTLTPKSWAYNSGAANDNLTRDANRDYLRRIWLRPAIMRNVSTVSTESTVFGCKLDIPVYISPVGAAKTIHEEGELPLARGAAASGIIQCIATPASYALDEILRETPTQAWYQLYINKERGKTENLVKQAERSGKVKAFFVTADLPVMSKREDDERVKPEGGNLGMVKISQDATGKPGVRKSAGLAKATSSFIDSSFGWEDLTWLRSLSSLPIVLKGVQRAEDARLAMQVGFDGIVVSNHGGRAADTAPPAILVLLEIHRFCPQVFGRLKVFVDGGFRRGSDVVKAVCLGASAVGLGRSFTFALNYGQEGVEHAVDCELYMRY